MSAHAEVPSEGWAIDITCLVIESDRTPTPWPNVSDSQYARHEAAHAVVAVRLGLPLESTDVESRPMDHTSVPGLPAGLVVNSGGLTKLTDGVIEGWID